jgi:hypothetical protein
MEKTLESEVRLLLDEQCAEPGFCLPAGERGILQGNPPRDLDAFTDAVFAAEEMDPGLHKGLRQAVRHKVQQRIGYWMASAPDACPDWLQFRGTTIAAACPPRQWFVRCLGTLSPRQKSVRRPRRSQPDRNEVGLWPAVS